MWNSSLTDEVGEVAVCCWWTQVMKGKDTDDGCSALEEETRNKSGLGMRLMRF